MMAATAHPFSEYVALGGGSHSKLWPQIVADVTGIPVARSTATEATCLGAGIMAATAAGWYSDVQTAADHMTNTEKRFIPSPETTALYTRLFEEVYQPLFPTLQPLLHRLAELVHNPGPPD
jgi:xylulokinase